MNTAIRRIIFTRLREPNEEKYKNAQFQMHVEYKNKKFVVGTILGNLVYMCTERQICGNERLF